LTSIAPRGGSSASINGLFRKIFSQLESKTMLEKLFATKPPLDQPSVDWIFEVFAWGLQYLGSDVFQQHTVLVLPDDTHFPGRASSVEEMARLMFDRTKAYAGMDAWPLTLIVGAELPARIPASAVPNPLRGAVAVNRSDSLALPYDPRLVNNPEAMIAGFAQLLAHYLGSEVPTSAPGGIQNWPQTTEVLGVFLGFGVLFANTAFNFRPRACGSCSGPAVERQVFLSQYDITYALAIFCVLKSIPNRQVLKTLKPSLRGYFKRCRRDVEQRRDALAGLADAARALPGVEAPRLRA
jgi:hypothetical protein